MEQFISPALNAVTAIILKFYTSIHPWAVLDSKCYGAVVWLQSSCWVIKQ